MTKQVIKLGQKEFPNYYMRDDFYCMFCNQAKKITRLVARGDTKFNFLSSFSYDWYCSEECMNCDILLEVMT